MFAVIRICRRGQQHNTCDVIRIFQCITESQRTSPRVADQDRVLDAQSDESFVKDPGLVLDRRFFSFWPVAVAMSRTVDRDDAIILRKEIHHSKFEIRGVSGVSVYQHNVAACTALDVMYAKLFNSDHMLFRTAGPLG